jgi:hypothetical protein
MTVWECAIFSIADRDHNFKLHGHTETNWIYIVVKEIQHWNEIAPICGVGIGVGPTLRRHMDRRYAYVTCPIEIKVSFFHNSDIFHVWQSLWIWVS